MSTIRELVEQAIESTKTLLDKRLIADRGTIESRSAICATCDSRLGFVCRECGCPIYSKVRLWLNSCPLKKWEGKSNGSAAG